MLTMLADDNYDWNKGEAELAEPNYRPTPADLTADYAEANGAAWDTVTT